jgi:hypothetical protein
MEISIQRVSHEPGWKCQNLLVSVVFRPEVELFRPESESARLRKRFQLVKEKLLEMGREAGLVKKNDD